MDVTILIISLIILLIAFFLFLKRQKNNETSELVNEILQKEINENNIIIARYEERIDNILDEKTSLISRLDAEKLILKKELAVEQEKNYVLSKALESTRAFYEAEQEKLKAQRIEIDTMKTQFNKDFELIANKILEEKTLKFNESQHKSLDQILHPFKENIKAFEDKVDKVYKAESDERNTLKGIINTLVEQSKQIQNEAHNLTKALKGDNKKQGNWGEIILERVLERSGLVKGSEYRVQTSYINDQGQRLQPDVIIDLPDEKNLIIDAKVSLIAYERWVNTEIEEEKILFAKQHIESLRGHIINLASKNYCDLYQINSPDFVLLFVPIESSFSLSIALDNELFNFAWDRRVVMVSPSTLLATLRTIAGLWTQERQNRNVLEIAREAGLLYDKFVGFIEDFSKIEKQISALAKSHEDARKKLDSGRGNVISKIEKLKTLGAKTSKQIDPKYLDVED
jgi:DNA recombination protein RmuC